MRWIGGRESSNVDDRRGIGAGGIAVGGGILGVIVLVLQLLLGGGGGEEGQVPIQIPGQTQELSPEEKAADDERAKFVKVVLGYTEDVWNQLFAQQGSHALVTKVFGKETQLEQMISNIMKAASETQTNIANNLKAS